MGHYLNQIESTASTCDSPECGIHKALHMYRCQTCVYVLNNLEL